MKNEKIINKFGQEFIVDDDTFRLGIDIKFSDHLAKRFINKIVLETCAGGGFTTISLAKYAKHVYSFEIDKKRIEDAEKNCIKAGVSSKVSFINRSIFEIEMIKKYKGIIEAAFIDPDWDNLKEEYQYRFENSMTKPASDELLTFIFNITKNVTLIQPPFIDKKEFKNLPQHEFEELIIENEKALYCLHFGDLIIKKEDSKYCI